jgi:hypothetical protein
MERVLSISSPRIASRQDGLVTILPALQRLVGGVLGCCHRRMSWPITRDGQTYRACLKCGICRGFDPKTWKTFGSFYRWDQPDRRDLLYPTKAYERY